MTLIFISPPSHAIVRKREHEPVASSHLHVRTSIQDRHIIPTRTSQVATATGASTPRGSEIVYVALCAQ